MAGIIVVERGLCQGLLPAAATQLYAAPMAPAATMTNQGFKAKIEEILLCNTGGLPARTVSLWVGTAASTASQICSNLLLVPNETKRLQLATIIEIGCSLWGMADSAGQVCLTASGKEYRW